MIEKNLFAFAMPLHIFQVLSLYSTKNDLAITISYKTYKIIGCRYMQTIVKLHSIVISTASQNF